MTDFTLLPAQEECDKLSLDEILLKLHRNDPISPSLVTTIARHAAILSESICTDFETLNRIITRHEATIRTRWLKKSVAQRRELLLNAWPDMTETHRQDYIELIGSRLCGNCVREDYGEPGRIEGMQLPSHAMVWPYINLEDLVKPRSLLIFLNARGRNTPRIFADTETLFSPLGKVSECGAEPELKKYALRFSATPSPAEYGVVLVRAGSSDMLQANENGFTLCLRPSLPTLEIQRRILSFLVTCSRLILHEMTEDILLHGTVQDEPCSAELQLRSDFGHTTFSDAMMIAPYRNRGSIDFARLHGYISALYTNAKDHLWALREDPSYFAEALVEIADHGEENILDSNGRVDPHIDTVGYLRDKARELVFHAYYMLAIWRDLDCLTEKLQNLSEYTQGEEFGMIMAEFYCQSREAYQACLRTLRRNAKGAPKMRKFFVRNNNLLASGTGISYNVEEMPLWQELKLVVCFVRLDTDVPFPDSGLVYHLLDHLDTLMRANEKARDIVSPRLSRAITELSVVLECIFQYRAWENAPERYRLHENTDHSHDERYAFDKWLLNVKKSYLPVRLISPKQGKLHYPAHKGRTKIRVTAMRKAEANLDQFWGFIDEMFERKTGISQHPIIRECILEGGKMQRTPPWVDAELGSQSLEKSKPVDNLPPKMAHDKTNQITGAFDKLSIKEKLKSKTKGHTEQNLEPDVIALVTENDEGAQKRFPLDKRAYKAIKALFHVSSSNEQDLPKAVKWDEFKRAMVRIGFDAEKLQGSAWQFTPRSASGITRGIQFHEPHPDSEIPYIMARRFGRRLARVYGWSGDTFRLA